MRASKKMYFEKNLKNAKRNPKKTWLLLKEAIGSTSNNSKINELIVNGEKWILDNGYNQNGKLLQQIFCKCWQKNT